MRILIADDEAFVVEVSVICEVHHRFVTHGIGVETVNRHVEIGRASCRERV